MSFSESTLVVRKKRTIAGAGIRIPFKSLFDTKAIGDFSLPDWKPECHLSEAKLFFSRASHLLAKFGTITLNRSYKQHLRDSPSEKIECHQIGIGSRKLWYGESDCRIRASPTGSSTLVISSSPDNDDDSDSDTSLVEANKFKVAKHIRQATATIIVHSFTENTHHPKLNPMVPMLLLNGTKFQIFLYDCVKDVLLISSNVEYVREDDTGGEFSVAS